MLWICRSVDVSSYDRFVGEENILCNAWDHLARQCQNILACLAQ